MDRGHARAVIMILSSTFLFPVTDAIGKLLAMQIPVPQVVWGRLFFQCLVIALISFYRSNRSRLGTKSPLLQLSRSILWFANIMLLIAALPLMPLATAVTVLFTYPIFVTLFSGPLLGEEIGARRWTAVLLGFAGTALAMRPGFGVTMWGILLVVGAAVAAALFQIVTRRLAATDPSFATLFYTSLGSAVLSSLALKLDWVPLTIPQWELLALSGIVGGASSWLVIEAFSRATPAALAPLSYFEILWAAVLGLLLFQEIPDGWMILGALLIIAGSAYSASYRNFRRESAR